MKNEHEHRVAQGRAQHRARVARRDFLVGGTAVVASGSILALSGERADPDDQAVAVDVLVVGGGVQGLAVLRLLSEAGYSALLVSGSDLGSGQTLHSHGLLNSGYLFPRGELRKSLKEDWIPFAKAAGLELYGEDHTYVVAPSGPLATLQPQWSALGYESETVSSEELPSPHLRSLLEPGGAGTQHLVRIREYTFPKRQLIRMLARGMEPRMMRGRIVKFHCSAVEGEQAEHGGRGGIVIEAVEVELRGAVRKMKVKPRWVVTAAGTGTRALVESMAYSPSFGKAARKLGVDRWRARTDLVSQVEEVAARKVHMICVRAPKAVLPAVNLFLLQHQLMLVTADVDGAHDRMNGPGDGRITWYVTPANPDALPERAPDMAQAEVNDTFASEGFRKLMELFPFLRAAAAKPNSPVEFGLYAGYKQDIGTEKNRPVCKRLNGIGNVMVTLPSLMTGAFVNARKVLEQVRENLEPGGVQPAIAGLAEGLQVGHVTENTPEVRWMNWRELSERLPGVDA